MSHIKVVIRQIDIEYMEANYAGLMNSLCDIRREKALRLKSTRAQYTSIMAGLLLQDMAKQICGISGDDIRICENDRGKPYIEGCDDFRFNLSHSGKYVMIAVSDSDVGVDIEYIRKWDPMVAKKCFTKDENAYIQDCDENFFRIWTMKEAYLKCIGTGISTPLNSFNVNPDKLCVDNTGYKYQVNVLDDYVYSICAEDVSDIDIKIEDDWQFNDTQI